eukprot:820780-Amphidinium_carterae.1
MSMLPLGAYDFTSPVQCAHETSGACAPILSPASSSSGLGRAEKTARKCVSKVHSNVPETAVATHSLGGDAAIGCCPSVQATRIGLAVVSLFCIDAT